GHGQGRKGAEQGDEGSGLRQREKAGRGGTLPGWASVGMAPEGVNPVSLEPRSLVRGRGTPRLLTILTRVRIVLPRLSPQGASGKLATFLHQSFLRRPGLSTRAAFSLPVPAAACPFVPGLGWTLRRRGSKTSSKRSRQ